MLSGLDEIFSHTICISEVTKPVFFKNACCGRLQSNAVPVNHIEGGKHLDSGAFGNIEKASFHGSKVAVKYVRPKAGKV